MDIDADSTLFFVVVNDEEQYALWPTFKDVPAGWRAVTDALPKADCLAYVDEHWTDMRPASLRRAMSG